MYNSSYQSSNLSTSYVQYQRDVYVSADAADGKPVAVHVDVLEFARLIDDPFPQQVVESVKSMSTNRSIEPWIKVAEKRMNSLVSMVNIKATNRLQKKKTIYKGKMLK